MEGGGDRRGAERARGKKQRIKGTFREEEQRRTREGQHRPGRQRERLMRKHGWQPGSVPHRSQSLLDLPSGSSSSPCSLVLFLFGRQDLAAQPGLTSDPRVSCLYPSGAAMAGVSYHTWFEFPGSALHGLQSQATPFLWWPVKRSVAPKKTEETFELPSKEVCPLGAPPRLSQACHLQVTLLERASLLLEGCCSPGFSGAARPPSPDIPPATTVTIATGQTSFY